MKKRARKRRSKDRGTLRETLWHSLDGRDGDSRTDIYLPGSRWAGGWTDGSFVAAAHRVQENGEAT